MKYGFKIMVPLTYEDSIIDSEEVELSEQELSLIKRLVGKSRNKRYGLMPILEEGAPELYEKLWNAIEKPLYETIIEDGRRNWGVGDKNEDVVLDMDCVDYICQIPKFAK